MIRFFNAVFAILLFSIFSCGYAPPPAGETEPFYAPRLNIYDDLNQEEYRAIAENEFLKVFDYPLSTFAIDVDCASYSNVRRFINDSRLPPEDAVRIEELVNYFNYNYPEPAGQQPFEIYTEISDCPWSEINRLVHIGLKSKSLNVDDLPRGNFVFLIDVSGSMDYPNKLPLLKSAFKILVESLRDDDRVAIVTYAGQAGLVLNSTRAKNKRRIIEAINSLKAGGSTAGAAGIELAYEIAGEHFISEGNNRVILATDGDFNVGISSERALENLIEKKRNEGIFLSVLGFGIGNIKDNKMELLADKGNGNYAYIDNFLEAKKVLVNEFGGTLFTIAKDVKIQVEFNPLKVKEYRLVGYENRLLERKDFDDDAKDAGDMGAGHTVTALYELIPMTEPPRKTDLSELKYQTYDLSSDAYFGDELLNIKIRYKYPDQDSSRLAVQALVDDHVPFDRTSDAFRFSAAVAEFGMLLRNSRFKGTATYDQVLSIAAASRGDDVYGYRGEFVRLAETAALLTGLSEKD